MSAVATDGLISLLERLASQEFRERGRAYDEASHHLAAWPSEMAPLVSAISSMSRGDRPYISPTQAVEMGRFLNGGWSILATFARVRTQTPIAENLDASTLELILRARPFNTLVSDLRLEHSLRPVPALEELHIQLVMKAILATREVGSKSWDDIIRFARWRRGAPERFPTSLRLVHKMADGAALHLFIPPDVLAFLFAISPTEWAYWAGVGGLPGTKAMGVEANKQYARGLRDGAAARIASDGLDTYLDWLMARMLRLPEDPWPRIAGLAVTYELRRPDIREHPDLRHLREYLKEHHVHEADAQDDTNGRPKCVFCGAVVK